MKGLLRFVSWLLLVAIILVLVAKLTLIFHIPWFEAYTRQINLLLYALLGIVGIFEGAQGKTVLHVLVLLSGIYLVLFPLLPSFSFQLYITLGTLLLVLLSLIFMKRSR